MRVIKFRAWHKERKEWISGRQPDADDLFIEETDREAHGYSITHWTQTVIMQFAGLSDKNGIEIYEGDIVKITTTGISWGKEYTWTGDVIFSRGAFVVKSKDGKKDKFTMFAPDRPIEVIGNIYENPELKPI